MPTREELLDAAERVIRRCGVGGATTRQIAVEAGCAEGTLYNHFDDKQDLVFCVLSERLPSFIPFVAHLPERAGTGSVRDTLVELAGLAIGFYTEVTPLTASTIADPAMRERHRASVAEHDRGPHRAVEAVAAYLRAEQAHGRVDGGVDADAAALLLLGGCFHAAFLRLVTPAGRLADDDLARRTVDALLTGLTARQED